MIEEINGCPHAAGRDEQPFDSKLGASRVNCFLTFCDRQNKIGV
jgi:hypothetical protein